MFDNGIRMAVYSFQGPYHLRYCNLHMVDTQNVLGQKSIFEVIKPFSCCGNIQFIDKLSNQVLKDMEIILKMIKRGNVLVNRTLVKMMLS